MREYLVKLTIEVFGLCVAEPQFFIILELSEQIGRKDWKK
jgi:hypothetical protein